MGLHDLRADRSVLLELSMRFYAVPGVHGRELVGAHVQPDHVGVPGLRQHTGVLTSWLDADAIRPTGTRTRLLYLYRPIRPA